MFYYQLDMLASKQDDPSVVPELLQNIQFPNGDKKNVPIE